jgi:hypothetical protein
MTVYVDDAFIRARVGRITSRWCHLFADTEEELHVFAQSIGLRRSWYQVPKGPGGKGLAVPESLKAQMWHYDITEGRRVDAVARGAVVVTRREAHNIMRARHARLFPDHAIAATPVTPEPPLHVWPEHFGTGLPNDFELRQGARWCRRCGRMLWRVTGGEIENVKPCAVVPVTFRGANVGAVTDVRRVDEDVL